MTEDEPLKCHEQRAGQRMLQEDTAGKQPILENEPPSPPPAATTSSSLSSSPSSRLPAPAAAPPLGSAPAPAAVEERQLQQNCGESDDLQVPGTPTAARLVNEATDVLGACDALLRGKRVDLQDLQTRLRKAFGLALASLRNHCCQVVGSSLGPSSCDHPRGEELYRLGQKLHAVLRAALSKKQRATGNNANERNSRQESGVVLM